MHQSYVRPGSAAAAACDCSHGRGISSDEILVERIAAGDKLAMQALFARHRTNIYRWPRPAERCVLDVWQQTGRFEGRSAVTTWLLSIARFKALSARRRRTDAELDKTIETTVADSADDPEIALQKKGRSELLRRALMKLSPHHREIIDLVYYHEKSVDDCAHPWHCGRDREDPDVLCPQEAC